MKTYLEKDLKEIEHIENKYNFLPVENCRTDLMDKLCLNKTISIAECRKQFIHSEKLEKILKCYREYAVKISG